MINKRNNFSFLSIILSVCMVFQISIFAVDTPKNEKTDVIIYANDAYFENIDEAKAELLKLTHGNIEITNEFSAAFLGFSAKMTSEMLYITDADERFDAHESGNFAPLSVSEIVLEEQSMYASSMINAGAAHDSSYTGASTVVAVIDSGFDAYHEAFANDVKNPVYTKESMSDAVKVGLHSSEHVKDDASVYINSKIPYAFNYASNNTDVSGKAPHGTHVASIIGANSDKLKGVAPDCQLLLMKVFDQGLSFASEATVLKALEDAMMLDADAVNMSLGTYSGFAKTQMIAGMTSIAKKLENHGITVVCAAGNNYSSAYSSYYDNNYGIIAPLADMTDYGTLNYPSSIDTFVSVAAAENTDIVGEMLIHTEPCGEINYIPFNDSNMSCNVLEESFIKHFEGQTLEYVPVPKLGSKDDFKDVDVRGKIALVNRGVITFSEKVRNAYDAGALGVIVSNTKENENVTMDIKGAKIPAILISYEDGKKLSRADNKSLEFNYEQQKTFKNPHAFEMSEYSSWGVTPELDLKPDISAPGTSIYAASEDGSYVSLTGTSMASPFVCGAAALLSEKLNREESKYISGKRPAYIKKLLMNSAKVLTDPETGAEYSARKQGAGLMNIDQALKAQIEIYTISGAPSLSLRDALEREFEFELVFENITENDIETEISVGLIHDKFAEVELANVGKVTFNTLYSVPYKNATVKVGDSDTNIYRGFGNGEKITIPALECKTLKFKVVLDKDEYDELSKHKNGFFTDGFVYAKTNEATYSLPFTGFHGNFGNAPIFDKSVYGNERPFYDGNKITSLVYGKQSVTLGNVGNESSLYSEDLITFSPNGDGNLDEIYLSPSLLRNCVSYSVSVKDKYGEVLYNDKQSAFFTKNGGGTQPSIFLWDGKDRINTDYIFADGDYTVSVTVYLFDKEHSETADFNIKIDTTLPLAEGYSVEEKDGRKILHINAVDENRVKFVKLYSTATDYSALDYDNNDTVFDFDVTDIGETILWADICDYAMNVKTAKIIL